MQKYVHKQKHLIVEAVQLTEDNIDMVSNWANGAQIVAEKDSFTHEAFEGLNIKTPKGKVRASRGQYVVKYEGHFFVANAGTFESLYSHFEPIQQQKSSAVRPVNPIKDPFEGMTRFNEGPKP